MTKSFHYPASGICRLRSENLNVDFFANGVGTAGLGNHKHNDILSFTLAYQGRPILIDPGTFVYTADEHWRNLFRSTAGHNTVTVDGFEQNRMIGGLLFLLRPDSHPEIVSWESNALGDLVVAENDGYCRLDDPVIHRRSLYLHKETEVLLLRDELIAQGLHRLDFNFHCDNIRITLLQHDMIHLQPGSAADGVLLSCCDTRLNLAISTNWVSPSYGIRHAGMQITGTVKTKLPFTALFALAPARGLGAEKVAERLEIARNAVGW